MTDYTKESIFLRAALTYAARGWHVFPLIPRSKKPLNANGVLGATTDEAQIRAWWKESPSANIGIATGRSGLVVIDVDEGGDVALNAWVAKYGLPLTVMAATPTGGAHLLFSYAGDEIAPGVDIFGKGSKVDVRAANSYIVATPSIHPDGGVYKWDKDAHPARTELAELPAALLELLVTPKAPENRGERSEPELIESGQDEAGARRAAQLATRGLSKEEARAALGAFIETELAGGWGGLDARRPWRANDVERWLKGAYEKFFDPDGGDPQAKAQRAKVDLLGVSLEVLEAAAAKVDDLIAEQAGKQGTGSVGTQTLNDLPAGRPPDQLVGPFLTAEGPTVIYGLGGAGKGYVSVYLARELVRQGKRVVVIDFEGHPYEWGRRSRSLGFSEAERGMVDYRAPFGDDWTAQQGPLAQVAALLRLDLDEREVDYVIIDSYTTGSSIGDSMGGQAAANEFFRDGVKKLGRPSLVIAHVAGGGERYPDKPFGSIFVHNQARETWAMAQWESEPMADGSGKMILELRNKKANGRPKAEPQFLTFTFDLLGGVTVSDQKPQGVDLADLIAGVLKGAPAPMTVNEIVAAIAEDYDQAAKKDAVNKALKRHPKSFVRVLPRPFKWSLVSGSLSASSNSKPLETERTGFANRTETGQEPDSLDDF